MPPKIVTKGSDGGYVCQVVGCDEFAGPWGATIPVGEVEIVVALCRRHERDFYGTTPVKPSVRAEA